VVARNHAGLGPATSRPALRMYFSTLAAYDPGRPAHRWPGPARRVAGGRHGLGSLAMGLAHSERALRRTLLVLVSAPPSRHRLPQDARAVPPSHFGDIGHRATMGMLGALLGRRPRRAWWRALARTLIHHRAFPAGASSALSSARSSAGTSRKAPCRALQVRAACSRCGQPTHLPALSPFFFPIRPWASHALGLPSRDV